MSYYHLGNNFMLLIFHWLAVIDRNKFWFITVQFCGWVYNTHQMNSSYIQLILPLSLKSMLGWIFVSSPLLILDIVIVYLCCFNLRFILIGFIWYKLPQDISILMSSLNSIKKVIMNEKYSWSDKVSSSFSGIPIKVYPSVLSNYNCS